MESFTFSAHRLKKSNQSGEPQSIEISHFKISEHSSQEIWKGLNPSPGILIVLPFEKISFCEIGEKYVEISKDRLLLLKGNRPFRILNKEGNAISENSPIRTLELNATVNKSSRLEEMLQLPTLLSSEESQKAIELCHQLIYRNDSFRFRQDSPDISSTLTLIELFRLLLSSSARADESQLNTKHSQQRQKLKEYLISTLEEKVTATDMAKALGLTRSYFTTHAQKLLGDSPSAFLRKIRLERSLELLINSDLSIEEISEDTGYSDRFSFSYSFKKHFGISPAKARKEHRASEAKVSVQAQTLFDNQQHEKALAMCDKALREKDQHLDLDAITYLKGQFLSLLGNRQEAMITWSALKSGPYAWQAKLQKFQFFFEADRFDEVAAIMGQLWANSKSDQQMELINIWIKHVSALRDQRRTKPLRTYLEIRRKYFAEDESTRRAATFACRETGRYLDILLHTNNKVGAHFRAYRSAGIYDKALELISPQENPKAYSRILRDAGRFEDVLAFSGGERRIKVEALIQLGKVQEAIQEFPEHCASAHLENGDFAMALKTCEKDSHEHLCALVGLGREKEYVAKNLKSTYRWFLIQLFVNPKNILDSNIPLANEFRNEAQLLCAMEHKVSRKQTLELIEKIPSIHSDYFWTGDSIEPSVLLRHVLPSFLGKSDQLEKDLKAMVTNFPLIYHQTLFYDASYLLGEKNFEEWMQQPNQMYLKSRGEFIQGLKEDLRGEHNKAREHYLAVCQRLLKAPYFEGLLRTRFAEWRLRELT